MRLEEGGRALWRGGVVVGEHCWGCNPGQWSGEDLGAGSCGKSVVVDVGEVVGGHQ